MTLIVAAICLVIGLGAGIFALRPKSLRSLDVVVDNSANPENFTLAHSLLLIGPKMNDKLCAQQRAELRRILQPVLDANYNIIEIYGENAPTENGAPYEWLDSQLLKRTLNAEDGFHMIHVNDSGRTGFHSGRPVVAEALLHILDLWDHISEEHEEALTDVSAFETDEAQSDRRAISVQEERDSTDVKEVIPHLALVTSPMSEPVPEPAPEVPVLDLGEEEEITIDEHGSDRKAPTHIAKAVRRRLTIR